MSTKLRHYVIQVRVNSLWQTTALNQFCCLTPKQVLVTYTHLVTTESPIRVCESIHGTELIPLVQLTIENLDEKPPVVAALSKPDVDDIPF